MERRKLNSSQIRSVGYDAAAQILEIEFPNGSIVQYSRVSSEVHRRLLASPSPGSYFRDQIDESYSSRKVR
ncbi:MAG: KTSC domain-containing protein [Betaproteobacteria bacterium]|nr:KTSC domain-containing protein [Betaproteobacteria bacterium]